MLFIICLCLKNVLNEVFHGYFVSSVKLFDNIAKFQILVFDGMFFFRIIFITLFNRSLDLILIAFPRICFHFNWILVELFDLQEKLVSWFFLQRQQFLRLLMSFNCWFNYLLNSFWYLEGNGFAIFSLKLIKNFFSST